MTKLESSTPVVCETCGKDDDTKYYCVQDTMFCRACWASPAPCLDFMSGAIPEEVVAMANENDIVLTEGPARKVSEAINNPPQPTPALVTLLNFNAKARAQEWARAEGISSRHVGDLGNLLGDVFAAGVAVERARQKAAQARLEKQLEEVIASNLALRMSAKHGPGKPMKAPLDDAFEAADDEVGAIALARCIEICKTEQEYWRERGVDGEIAAENIEFAIAKLRITGITEPYTPCDRPYADCSVCKGTGKRDDDPCSICVWRRWAEDNRESLRSPEEVQANRDAEREEDEAYVDALLPSPSKPLEDAQELRKRIDAALALLEDFRAHTEEAEDARELYDSAKTFHSRLYVTLTGEKSKA